MSATTQNAIHVYGYDKEEYLEALLEMLSPDQIPIQYGGTKDSTPVSADEGGIWNWNNPVIEKILQVARETGTFRVEDCFSASASKPKSVHDSDPDTVDDDMVTGEQDKVTSVETSVDPGHHRHEHRYLEHDPRQNASQPDTDTDTLNSSIAQQNNAVFHDIELQTNIIITEHLDDELFASSVDKDIESESVTIMPDIKSENPHSGTSVLAAQNDTNYNGNEDFVFENVLNEKKDTTTKEMNSSADLPLPVLVFILPFYIFLMHIYLM